MIQSGVTSGDITTLRHCQAIPPHQVSFPLSSPLVRISNSHGLIFQNYCVILQKSMACKKIARKAILRYI